jgi:hypothetical protein
VERFIGTDTIRVGSTRDIDEFALALPAIDSGGVCREISVDRPEVGDRVRQLILDFPALENSMRRVSIVLDSTGAVAFYNDERGPPVIVPPGADTSRAAVLAARKRAREAHLRSSVSLNFARDEGFVLNRGGGRPMEAASGRARAMLYLENLGVPARMISLVRSRCESR